MAKDHEKELADLRMQMQKLKQNINNPKFVMEFQAIRLKAMAFYREHPGMVSKEDLVLFGIIVNK